MNGSAKVVEYLNSKNVVYEMLEHPLAYSATETAKAQHVSGQQLLKSVIVKADGRFIMCVLASTQRIDFEQLKAAVGAKEVFLAQETELEQIFPDYELGAEPPFGHLCGMDVYLDANIAENEEVQFNAGTHTQIVKLKYRDLDSLVHPIVVEFGVHI
jgi:Ala-tRNA(Pro) deacylase